MATTFCATCDEEQLYTIHPVLATATTTMGDLQYVHAAAHCGTCGQLLHLPTLTALNDHVRETLEQELQ